MNAVEKLGAATKREVAELHEKALNRLARTFAAQMEALKRYRSKGEQRVYVERVNVSEGGQAVIGNVSHGGSGGGSAEMCINSMRQAPRCSPRAGEAGCDAKDRRFAASGSAGCMAGIAGSAQGERNGRYKHGKRTKAAIEARRETRDLIRDIQECLRQLGALISDDESERSEAR